MSAPIVVQYVIVRGDLLKALKWPVGAVIAQACHACSAVMHLYHDDPSTVEYVKNLDSMHKIVLEVRTRLDLERMTGVCVCWDSWEGSSPITRSYILMKLNVITV